MKNKLYSIIFYIIFLVANNLVQSQEQEISLKSSKESYAEKVYLQLSSNIFTTDETVWFKAIVTNAIDHMPTKLSGIVYVELIDFDKKVMDTKKLKLENGIADSFFQLNERYPSGRYLVRAYTEWNKNFGQDFIFNQYINLFSRKDVNEVAPIQDITLTETNLGQYKISAKIFPENLKADYKKDLQVYIHINETIDSVEVIRNNGMYILDYVLPKETISAKLKLKLEDTKLKNKNFREESTYSKTVVIDSHFLDVQFFPEGGKMIDGLTSKVAFKAIDYKGLGAVISGHIIDEDGTIILPIKTNELGMGYTVLKPNKGKTYYGKIVNNDGTIYKYQLPEVHALGYVLTVTEIGNYLDLKIEANIENTDSLFIQVRTRGVLLEEHPFKLENKFHEALIEKQKLRDGIIGITLFDKNYTPICERLFFNMNEYNRLNVTAKTQLKHHGQRDKTKLNVVVNNSENKPVNANISALIVDKNQLGNSKNLQPNILSYFLLNSELKGNIESPKSYFDDANLFRKRDLEALMLTQGWSNYIFNRTNANYNFEIKPETDLWVKGKVGSVLNADKPVKKQVDLSMLTFGDPRNIYIQKTDSLGHFAFNLKNEYADKLNVVIQSTNLKGVAKEYNITLDKATAPPRIIYEEHETIELADTISKLFLEKSIAQKEQQNGFNLSSNTIELNTVELIGYNLSPEREKIFKLHGLPDVVIKTEELEKAEENWMYGLYSVLKFRFPDDINIIKGNESEYLRLIPGEDLIADENTATFDLAQVNGADYTFVLIDGEVVKCFNYPLIPNLPVNAIKSFEILKNPKGAQQYFLKTFPHLGPQSIPLMASYAIISVYTYAGKGLLGITETKGVFKGTIDGFSTKREFYAPKYDNLQPKDWDFPDLRSVIHWSPSVTTDENGQANIEFYNADNTGDMLVIVEAIAPDGKVGYFETTYKVDKKLEK